MCTLGRATRRRLGTVSTASSAHCATADTSGSVYVCAPQSGKILTFHDAYPSSL